MTGGPHGAGTLRVSVARSGHDAPVMALSGELDMATTRTMSDHLSELVRSGTDVVVDLRGLCFIDSSGLSALMAARQQSEDRGTTLTLRAPTRTVTRLLTITGLDRVFTIEP